MRPSPSLTPSWPSVTSQKSHTFSLPAKPISLGSSGRRLCSRSIMDRAVPLPPCFTCWCPTHPVCDGPERRGLWEVITGAEGGEAPVTGSVSLRESGDSSLSATRTSKEKAALCGPGEALARPKPASRLPDLGLLASWTLGNAFLSFKAPPARRPLGTFCDSSPNRRRLYRKVPSLLPQARVWPHRE